MHLAADPNRRDADALGRALPADGSGEEEPRLGHGERVGIRIRAGLRQGQARGSKTPATADLRIRIGLAQALMIEGRSFRYDFFEDAPIMPGTAQVLKEKGEIDAALGLIKPARIQHIDFSKPFMIAERALEDAGRIDDPSLPPIDRCVAYLHAHTVIQASKELISKIPENEHQKELINRAMATVDGQDVLSRKVKALEEKSAGLRDAVVSLLRLTDADIGLTLRAAKDDQKVERFGIRLAEGWLTFSTKSLISILTTNPATVETGAADAAFRSLDAKVLERAVDVMVRTEDVNLARQLLAIAARCDDPYPNTLHGLNALVFGLVGNLNAETLEASMQILLDLRHLDQLRKNDDAFTGLPIKELSVNGFELLFNKTLAAGLDAQIAMSSTYAEYEAERAELGLVSLAA